MNVKTDVTIFYLFIQLLQKKHDTYLNIVYSFYIVSNLGHTTAGQIGGLTLGHVGHCPQQSGLLVSGQEHGGRHPVQGSQTSPARHGGFSIIDDDLTARTVDTVP